MFHWSVFQFLCQHHAVLMITALYYSLKSGRLILSALFFIKIVLAIRGRLCFHTNCESVFSSSVKNIIGSFRGIALNL